MNVWRIAVAAAGISSACVMAHPARPGMVAHSGVEAHPFQQPGFAPQPVFAPPPPVAGSDQFGPTQPMVSNQAWVDGHFNLDGGRYAWEQGHWQTPPQPGLHWQQPAWNNNQWFPGFWAGQDVPPAYGHLGPWNPGWNNPGALVGAPLQGAVGAAVSTVGRTGATTVVVP